MSKKGQKRGSGGTKKHGRAKIKCERYKLSGKREKHRDIRLKRKEKELNKYHSESKYEIQNITVKGRELINIKLVKGRKCKKHRKIK